MATIATGTNGVSPQPQDGATSSASAAWSFQTDLPATDALAYYDDEIDRPGMRARVERAVAAEMKKGGERQQQRVSDDRLPPPITLFASRPDLQEQIARICQHRQPTAALDKSRYALDDPVEVEQGSDDAWRAAIRNAEAQLAHSDARLTNVDLLKRLGANQWRLHNFQQEAFVRAYTDATTELQADTTALNRARKTEQAKVGQELLRLSRRWAELLNRSLSVELANMVAQGDIEELEGKRDGLRKRVARLESA